MGFCLGVRCAGHLTYGLLHLLGDIPPPPLDCPFGSVGFSSNEIERDGEVGRPDFAGLMRCERLTVLSRTCIKPRTTRNWMRFCENNP